MRLAILLLLAAAAEAARVVLTFHRNTNEADASAFKVLGIDVVKQYGRRLVMVVAGQQPTTEDLVQAAGLSEHVQHIETDDVVGQETTTFSEQWNVQALVAAPNSSQQKQQQQNTIALLDTGFFSAAGGYDFVSDNETSMDGDGRDPDATDPGGCQPSSWWHGSKMAHILTGGQYLVAGGEQAYYAGLAPDANVLSLRVLGSCGAGYASDVADAIVWAAGGWIKGVPDNAHHRARVVAMPFAGAGPCPSFLQSAVYQAVRMGAVLVAAAGNQARDYRDFFPANCIGVTPVAATTASGALAPYSNYGNMTVAAPGGDSEKPIPLAFTTTEGKLQSLGQGIGTSIATMEVAAFVWRTCAAEELPPHFLLKWPDMALRPLTGCQYQQQCPLGAIGTSAACSVITSVETSLIPSLDPYTYTAISAVNAAGGCDGGCGAGSYQSCKSSCFYFFGCIGSCANAYCQVCQSCPSGYTCADGIGIEAYVRCQSGQYYYTVPSATQRGYCVPCQACGANQYRSNCFEYSQGKCETCWKPWFSSFKGTSCDWQCNSGYKYEVSNFGRNENCIECARGEYGTGGSCNKCQVGKYNSELAVTACLSCGPGTYSPSTGASTCTACGTGQFSAAGATACQYCVVGKAPSASSICEDFRCSVNRVGYYTTQVGPSDWCTTPCASCGFGQIPDGKCGQVPNAASKGGCNTCDVSLKKNGEVYSKKDSCTTMWCTSCGKGQYNPNCTNGYVGACTSCTSAAKNTFYNSSGCATAPCVPCIVGSYRAGCYPFSDGGVCAPCTGLQGRAGYYTSHGGFQDNCTFTLCYTDCEVGKYNSNCDKAACNASCTAALKGGSYFSTGGGVDDSCKVCPPCRPGYTPSTPRATCTCSACDNLGDATFPVVNKCNFLCNEGRFAFCGYCWPCAGCPEGQYRQCNTQRIAELPANSGVCPNFESMFNDVQFYDSKAGPCLPCPAPPTGFYQKGCAFTSPGLTLPCTNAVVGVTYYTGPGGKEEDSCPIAPCSSINCKKAWERLVDCGLNSTCQPCPAGQIANGSQCISCPNATGNEEWIKETLCQFNCKGGYAKTERRCTACPAGTFSQSGEDCKPCPDNTSSGTASLQCTPCGSNEQQDALRQRCVCTPGYYRYTDPTSFLLTSQCRPCSASWADKYASCVVYDEDKCTKHIRCTCQQPDAYFWKNQTCPFCAGVPTPATQEYSWEDAADSTDLITLSPPGYAKAFYQLPIVCTCLAGFYKDSLTRQCLPCAPGTFLTSLLASACTTCAPGSYNTAPASSQCELCLPGTFDQGAGACQPCSVNTYSGSAGATACSNCTALQSTLGSEGATACTQCKASTPIREESDNNCSTPKPPCLFPGFFYQLDKACELCRQGFYCEGGALQVCPNSSRFWSPLGSSNERNCTADGPKAAAPVQCPQNTSGPAFHLLQCRHQPGYYGEPGTPASVCPLDHRCPSSLTLAPEPCNASTPYANPGSAECTEHLQPPCRDGFFFDTIGGSLCLPCPRGYQCKQQGLITACPPNTTSAPLSTACTEVVQQCATPALCPPNTIAYCGGCSSKAGFWAMNFTSGACPRGTYCPEATPYPLRCEAAPATCGPGYSAPRDPCPLQGMSRPLTPCVPCAEVANAAFPVPDTCAPCCNAGFYLQGTASCTPLPDSLYCPTAHYAALLLPGCATAYYLQCERCPEQPASVAVQSASGFGAGSCQYECAAGHVRE